MSMRYNGAIIISAFPACGKSYVTKNHNYDPFRLSDSDSSKFSWIYDENGNKTSTRNPNFITDYLNHIKQESRYRDFVFVSTHKDVRNALINECIPFILVYPVISMKEEMLKRMKDRGSDEEFIKFQDEHFESFVDEIEEDIFPRLDNILVALYQIDQEHQYIDIEMLEYLNSVY